MESARKRRRIIVVVLLIMLYVVVRRLTGWLDDPVVTLLPPDERPPFVADFALPMLDGTVMQWTALRGHPVVLNLWATWCYPCRLEMPSLQTLHQTYQARGLLVLAVAMDAGGHAVVAPFAQTHGLTMPILLDPQQMLAARLQVPGIPATYLLDKRGRIVGFETGARDWQAPAIRSLVEQLLAEEGGG